jgi:hypothetical protein
MPLGCASTEWSLVTPCSGSQASYREAFPNRSGLLDDVEVAVCG